jgi:hypothetical protein
MPSQNFDIAPVQIQNLDTVLNKRVDINSNLSSNLNNHDLTVTGFTSTLASRTYFRQFNTITMSGISFKNSSSASFIIEPTIITASLSGIKIKTILTGSFLQYNTITTLITQPSLSQRGGSAIFKEYNTMTIYPNIYINVSSIFISTGSIFISSSPVSQKYYVLSDWDGSNLSALDSKTLIQMDYQIV